MGEGLPRSCSTMTMADSNQGGRLRASRYVGSADSLCNSVAVELSLVTSS